jgi:glyoxylase-like metal-dependent hydrolase (beta-lactamase superfamily II)
MMSPASWLCFPYLSDGLKLPVCDVDVIGTPGHMDGCFSIVMNDHVSAGDTLLIGTQVERMFSGRAQHMNLHVFSIIVVHDE